MNYNVLPDPIVGGDVYFYHKPVFFFEQDGEKRVFNLSYIEHVSPNVDMFSVFMPDGYKHLSLADGERLMKLMEA